MRGEKMKKISGIVIIFTFICGMALNADPVDLTTVPFEFGCPKDAVPNTMNLMSYAFVYDIYMDVFARFELDGKLSTVDKAQVVHFISTYLSFEYPIAFSVLDFQGGQRLIISFRLKKTKEDTVMLMSTNFNVKTLKIVAEGSDMAGTYARLYYIRDGKFVNSNALFDAKKEKELLKAKLDVSVAKNGLADMYIFDERTDNDYRIEALLDESLKAAADDQARIAPLMTLAQYRLATNDIGKAELLVAECDGLSKKGTINENISRFTQFLREQLVMMKALPPVKSP
jgi:hypothetical protein